MTQKYEAYLSEYERALLALAFRGKETLVELSTRLTPEYFLYPPHKIVYLALLNLLKNEAVETVEFDTLWIECERLGIGKLGITAEYVLLLTQGGFDRQNFDFYFEKVKDAFLKYSLDNVVSESLSAIRKNAQDLPKNLNALKLLDQVAAEVSKLSYHHGRKESGVCFADVIEDFVTEHADNPTDVRGLRTGLPSLDKAINGLIAGSLTVIAGEAKAGKSTVMMNILDYIAHESDRPIPVLIISTEMSKDEDLSRLLAMRTLVEERKIMNGTAFHDPKLKKILAVGVNQIKSGKVFHEYLPFFDIAKVTNLITYYKLKYNIGLAIFDYIKMSTTGDDAEDRREDQVLGNLTTALKNIGGDLGIPILSGCQINTRSGNIADSDRIIRYCNTLITFHPKTIEELQQQDYHQYGTHWLRVKTARGGGNCKIPIRFWKACLKIQEADEYVNEEDAEGTEQQDFTLTTPLEWQKGRMDAFKMDQVQKVVTQVDGQDMAVEVLPSQSGATPVYDDPMF